MYVNPCLPPSLFLSLSLSLPLRASSQATATIDQLANVEAFGIANVELSLAILDGPGGAPWSPQPVLFSPGQLSGFVTTNTSVQTCGELGNVLTATTGSGVNASTFMASIFNNITSLPPHTALRLDLTVVFRHASGLVRATLLMDNQVVWTQTSSGVGAAPCGAAGVVPINVVVLQTDPSITFELVAMALDSVARPAISLVNMTITPVQLGSAPWTGTLFNFRNGLDSWTGSRVAFSNCGARGIVLGGPGVLGPEAFLFKTFTLLPAHTSLFVQLTFIFVGNWQTQTGQVSVDGEIVWNLAPPVGAVVTNDCGVRTTSVRVIRTVPHTASSVTLRVTTTLDAAQTDASFAIQNVIVALGDAFVGAGTGIFKPGFADFSNNQTDGWRVFNAVSVTCGTDTGIQSASNGALAAMSKQITGLPIHNAIEVNFVLVHRHQGGIQNLTLVLDGVTAWTVVRTTPSSNSSAYVSRCLRN